MYTQDEEYVPGYYTEEDIKTLMNFYGLSEQEVRDILKKD